MSGYIFKPESQELTNGVLKVQYSCAQDIYQRPNARTKEIKGWKSACFSQENMIRNREYQYETVYLCRERGGTGHGRISWKFDLTDCSFIISRVEVLAEAALFNIGEVVWTVEADNGEEETIEGTVSRELKFLSGRKSFTMMAHLSGGGGNHSPGINAQVFRQATQEKGYPFKVAVHFEPDQ